MYFSTKLKKNHSCYVKVYNLVISLLLSIFLHILLLILLSIDLVVKQKNMDYCLSFWIDIP